MSFNFSCRKEYIQAPVTIDSIPQSRSGKISRQFFNTHLPADENIIALRNKIMRQETQKSFVDRFVKFAGYPIWDKAVIKIAGENPSASNNSSRETINGKIIMIPLALDTQHRVNAVLQAKIAGNDTTFRILYQWQYNQNGYKDNSKFNSANQTALLFMGLESYTFGHHDFKINDSLLLRANRLSDTIHIESFDKESSERLMQLQQVKVHICYTVSCSGPITRSRIATSHTCQECVDFYEWEDDGTGSGGSGGGGIGGGGETGGGDDGGWQDDPCTPTGGSTGPQNRVWQLAPCDGGGSGDGGDDPWLPVLPEPLPGQPDPCETVQPFADKATTISKDVHFSQAKSDIQAASVDGNEHAVVFGKDAQGNISSSPMNNGDESSGTVDTDWPGGFADLHNHPDDQPPSPGDLYGLISVDQNHVGYDTRYVTTPDGSVYALVVTDLAAANTFATNYPKSQISPYPPDFPDPLFTDFDNARTYFEYNGFSHLIAEEKAMALVLDKYNSGIALFKQNSNGDFKKLGTTEAMNSDGIKTYTTNNCP